MAKDIKVKTVRQGVGVEQFLMRLNNNFNEEQIKTIADKSLEKFVKNTPSKSGKTANSWSYTIEKKDNKYYITFHNSNIQNGSNVAVLIENGRATRSGKWISGTHYIDQTIKEIDRDIVSKAWEELIKV